ncbi:DoxX-like family protein [Candidatus Uabimicrobium amorphum]|uniref:Membrane protein n=1 Tax=Uabimicrobium amorphum TaxID=2596890 RepID=A0A5S9IIM8_UABAM|nr:DoxX-like family protein [Candidatus Uabimicrobium amorphum]BBM82548.1 membrane protein [Candidatus Uabimicrobium amorphum]
MHTKIQVISNITLGICWIYQGLLPKIIARHPQEIAMVTHSGFFTENQAVTMVICAGIAECIFGILFFIIPSHKMLHFLNIAALTMLFVAAFFTAHELFIFPFNPATLSITMIALSLISLEARKTDEKQRL